MFPSSRSESPARDSELNRVRLSQRFFGKRFYPSPLQVTRMEMIIKVREYDFPETSEKNYPRA